MASIDPANIATQLASAFIQPMQTRLDEQTKLTQSRTNALTTLQTALQEFSTAASTLGGSSGALAYSATLSNTSVATATASASAQAGVYSLFVEKIASAHQVSFGAVPTVAAAGAGSLVISQADGSSFSVDLGAADDDEDGTVSQTELARAINQAADNGGKVSAMLATVNGTTQLMLASSATGASGKITLNTTQVGDASLKAALATGTTLSAGEDAVVWMGAQGTGVRVQQASNTFAAIQGVSVTLNQAMTSGSAPLSVTVARDTSETAKRLNSFVDAYNKLNKTLGTLTAAGGENATAGVFATDAGVRILRNRLSAILRESVGGNTLTSYGISLDRNGTLSLDQTKLEKALAKSPDGLQQVLGKTSLTGSSGVLGSFDTYIRTWSNSTDGQIKQRKENLEQLQKQYTLRQDRLDTQYNNAYTRYLNQFSQLQTLQAQMEENTSLFSSLFATSSS